MTKPSLRGRPGSGPLHPVDMTRSAVLARPSAPVIQRAVKGTGSTGTVSGSPTSGNSPATVLNAPLYLNVGAIDIFRADSGQDGALTAGDWTTFNSKEPDLGTPATDNFILTSLVAGTRSWKAVYAIPRGVATKTTAYAITAADDIILANAAGGAFTVTLPTPVGITGRAYTVKRINTGANAVTVATAAGTIDAAATVSLATAYQILRIVSDGANWWSI